MIVELEIRNWTKYNPRPDVKSCSWFRMSNDFFSDPDFYGCGVEARIVWVFVLSVASKKMAQVIRINTEMVRDQVKISESDVAKCLSELEELGTITILSDNVKSIRSNPIVTLMLPSATNEQTDRQTDNFSPTAPRPKKILPNVETQDKPNQDPLNVETIHPLEEEISVSDLARNVITALNAICFRNYRLSKANLKLVNARIKDGFTLEEFTTVFNFKQDQWGSDSKMQEYLRPATLLGSKFESYLEAARAAKAPMTDAEADKIISQYWPGA